ncbi:MAG: glycosyltransferase family 2 protein [Ferruginibacter sp.]
MKEFNKPYVSVIAPCYNEEAILELNIGTICEFMRGLEHKYNWEVLIVNDGSKDKTGEIADELARNNGSVRVIHHPSNLNLGNALQTGFRNATGDIIVVMDIDLSYGVEYIETMSDTLIKEYADIVMASPYMKGGRVTAVPFMRSIMSRYVNRFMSFAAQDKYHTFTGMVRAYRKSFIKTVNLKTKDYEIMPEIIYKSMILRAKIIEIPAHLDWTEQNKFKGQRTSSLRVIRSFFSGLMSAFIFRPYIFFMGIGAVLMALSLYELVWLLYDTLADLAKTRTTLPAGEWSFSHSLTTEFKRSPQAFLIGGITFIVAIQFLSLGFLSLQSKRYFEELFHLGTAIKNQPVAEESNTNTNN